MRKWIIAHLFIVFFLCRATIAFPQAAKVVHRHIAAVRTTQKIVIDGDISDNAWKTATMFKDFTEWIPSSDAKENTASKTEMYLLYDDKAIYIAGFCHEISSDSISRELVGRDVIGINDFAGVIFDTYNDKINGFGYYVTPLGEQYDAKYSNTGEDGSWNSVYESEAKIVKGGWTFEMKIPYSAIRFGNKDVQTWGIQLTRKRVKSGKQYMWNPINRTIGGPLVAQSGLLNDITSIKPPPRLSISPYISAYANHYPYDNSYQTNSTYTLHGGIDDLKYGINQSFTLDMTLFPDFGQVQSDNQILNLTPFEVKYNENRTFFTEGTELFSKGGLFYSRRVGGVPLHYYDVSNNLGATEVVRNNPSITNLINATKISGRTDKGLGIGVFNAISDAQYATIEDTLTKQIRTFKTSPVTNYNIIVLDQSLKNNSSISFINTNTARNGSDYSANVSAGLWDIYDKKSNYECNGQIAISQLIGYLPNGKTQSGYSHSITFAKTGGNFTYNIWQNLTTDSYSQNDMGYATNNNFFDNGFYIGYKWLKPASWYNNLYYNFNLTYSRHYNPSVNQFVDISSNINGQFKNLWNFYVYAEAVTNQNDFYEPRVEGRVYKVPYSYVSEINFGTNAAKKYSATFDIAYRHLPAYNGNYVDITPTNQYRFNKNLTISMSNSIQLRYNNVGYVSDSTNTSTNYTSVYFGNRNRITLENIAGIKYNFNNKMGLNFRARHYWSKVNYKNFYILNNDGSLGITGNTFADENVNYFNIDMLYTWQFALGSFINISWKSAAATDDALATQGYFKNLSNILSAATNNNFSIQVIYYLDYLKLRRTKKNIKS